MLVLLLSLLLLSLQLLPLLLLSVAAWHFELINKLSDKQGLHI